MKKYLHQWFYENDKDYAAGAKCDKLCRVLTWREGRKWFDSEVVYIPGRGHDVHKGDTTNQV